MKAAKVIHPTFNLSTVAGRVGLLCGITAGTVDRKEVEAAVLRDTEKRPYRKPVVARGKRYDSVTEAAVDICGKYTTRKEVMAMQKTIARYCNADNVEGFYWSE